MSFCNVIRLHSFLFLVLSLFDLSINSYTFILFHPLSFILPIPLSFSLREHLEASGLAQVLDVLRTQSCIYPTLTVLHICFDQAIFYEGEREDSFFPSHLIILSLSIWRTAQNRGIVTLWDFRNTCILSGLRVLWEVTSTKRVCCCTAVSLQYSSVQDAAPAKTSFIHHDSVRVSAENTRSANTGYKAQSPS